MLGKLENHMQKKVTGPLFYKTHKNFLTRSGLKTNLRPESIKLLD